MSVRRINLEHIVVETSRFSLEDFLVQEEGGDPFLLDSFETTGIVNPVTVLEEGRGAYHLVLGRARIHFARRKKLPAINAVVLPGTTSVTDIMILIFCDKRERIEKSTINKIQFIRCALLAGAWDSWVLDSLCPALGFQPYGTFLDDCQEIANLPPHVQAFCHEKKFSLKQVLNLTHFPGDILRQLMKWRHHLQLTASIMEEIATHMKDYLRSKELTVHEFLKTPEVQEIMKSPNNRVRTMRLRRFLYLKKFPRLSQANRKIAEIAEKMSLPDGVRLEWDRTLENREIHLQIALTDPGKWDGMIRGISSPHVRRAVRDILDSL